MIARLRRLPRPLLFLYAGITLNRMGAAFVFPFLTLYLTDGRGMGLGATGWVLGVGSLGLLAGNLTGGWLTDAWSRRRTAVLALLLSAAGFFSLSFPQDPPALYALFLFAGYFGSGMFTPAANTMVADLSAPEDRPFAYTVSYACINLGMAVGPLLGGALAALSYRVLFVGDALSSLACAGIVVVCMRETRGGPPSSARRAAGKGSLLSAWMRHPLVFAFCVGSFFLIAPLIGFEYAVPLLVRNEFGAALANIGWIYFINAALILSLSFPIERLLRGRHEMAMMVVAGGIWMAAVGFFCGLFTLPALMICVGLWTVGEIIASIVLPSFVSKHVAGSVRGRFLALNDAMRSLAAVVSPIALGFLWESQGVSAVLWAIFLLPAIGTLLYLALLLRRARRSPVPARSALAEGLPVEP